MKKFLVKFRRFDDTPLSGTVCSTIIDATSVSDAIGCIFGFVLSCEQLQLTKA